MTSVLTNNSFRCETPGHHLFRGSFTAAAALLLVCVVTAGCAGTADHAAKQAGTVPPQIITLPPDAAPSAMITATDGSLWVTEESISAVAEISPAGHVTQFRIPGSSNDPDGILQEGTGGQIVYVGFEQIGYVTPGRPITGYEDGQGVDPGLPVAIAVGPDGEIWYTNGMGSNPRISRINGSEGPVTVTALPGNVSFPARGLAAGPGNAVWFTEGSSQTYGNDGIGRVTETGAYSSWTLPPATDPQSITKGPDDAMWFTERTGIGRISSAGSIARFPVLGGTRPTSIIAGTDGALWFTTATGVGRITTAGSITTWPVVGAKDLDAISSAPDGTFWVADASRSVIRRFTPPASLRRGLTELPCTAAEFLKVLSDNIDLGGWTPQRYACSESWAIVAGTSKVIGVGIGFLHATSTGWQTTGLNDGSCMAATSKQQCPYPPTYGVPPHKLLMGLVHKAGLLITPNGSITLP